MEFISHRVNTIAELQKTDCGYGVELDIRDGNNDRLYISHEPFVMGEDFEEYLKAYHHGTMICNIKSERIEYRVKELLDKYNVKEYFFLDSSFPMIMQLTREGEKNIALRYSEYEGIDTLEKMRGRAKWVWIDCFERVPLDINIYNKLRAMGYKLCMVSPELQGRPEDIRFYKECYQKLNIQFDAICTKSYKIGEWVYD